MTAIIGIEHKGQVLIGADSAATDGWNSVEIITNPKCWARDGIAFGGCGQIRFIQLIRHAMQTPKLPRSNKPEVVDKWMVVDLANAMRAAWKSDVELLPEDYKTPDVAFLAGVRGRLYYVEGDLCAVHQAKGYAATGSGGEIALGVLLGTAKAKLQPKDRAVAALSAASEATAFVRPPFRFVTV